MLTRTVITITAPNLRMRGIIGLFVLAVLAWLPSVAVGQVWEIDPSRSNATVDGVGGGVMYSCASNAPSRGAVIVAFSGIARRGTLGGVVAVAPDLLTQYVDLECAPFDNFSMCAIETNDVPAVRDALIAGSRAIFSLYSGRSLSTVRLGSVVVSLRGSGRAIRDVINACGG